MAGSKGREVRREPGDGALATLRREPGDWPPIYTRLVEKYGDPAAMEPIRSLEEMLAASRAEERKAG